MLTNVLFFVLGIVGIFYGMIFTHKNNRYIVCNIALTISIASFIMAFPNMNYTTWGAYTVIFSIYMFLNLIIGNINESVAKKRRW
jgi:hypothetical protein